MNKLNVYHNKVYEILDFISIDEQKFFLDIIHTADETDWPKEIENEFEKKDTTNGGKVLFLNSRGIELRHEIDERIKTLFIEPQRINNIAAIQRYKTNIGMDLHKDNGHDPSVLYGAVIYLNEDFDGGEVYYPSLDLKIKPKARSIIVHPAGLDHEVLPVKGLNTRYMLSVFIRGDKKTRLRDDK
jgi:hypothetical protein